MKTTRFLFGILFIASVAFIAACGDDDDGDPKAGPLNLTSVSAVGTNPNTGDPVTKTLGAGGNTSGVPIDGVFTVTFSKDVDESTVNSTNFAITSGATAVPATVTAAGPVVTITPNADFTAEADYTLTLTSAIKGDDGGIFTQTTRTFTTAGGPLEDGLVAHFKFEDNGDDLTGDFNADNVIGVTYVAGRSTEAGKAASFNGTTSIIEIPNGEDLAVTENLTVSFWVKVNPDNKKADGTTQKGYFIMGFNGFRAFQIEMPGSRADTKMAATYSFDDNVKRGQDLWLDATGNTGFVGWTYSQDLSGEGGLPAYVDDKWAHFVYVYNNETKVGSIYLNGVLRKEQDFNAYPAGHAFKDHNATGLGFNTTSDGTSTGTAVAGLGTHFALGFYCSSETTAFDFATYSNVDHNHFKGLMDDVKIYHIAKTAAEVETQYNDEKP
jgi:hypothetical protein